MDISDEVGLLRNRLRDAERQLVMAHGEIAVLKSKSRAASDREEFLLGELVKISSDMRELLPDARAEAMRVRHHLNRLLYSGPAAPEFWSDRDRGYMLALLQDRAAPAASP